MSLEDAAGDTGGSDFVTFTPEEEAFFAAGAAEPAEAPAKPDAPPAADAVADPNKPADGDKPAADKTPQNVPLAALHEERNKRKALGSELETLKTQLAEQSGKLSILLKLKGGEVVADEQPAGPPSAEDDIFGAVKHVGETVAQMQKRLDDAEAAKKAGDEQTVFRNNYQADANAFMQKTPDYKAAYDHLMHARCAELISVGYEDPNVLQAEGADIATVQAAAKALHDAIVADEFAIADRAFKSKKSPAQIIYDLAKQRGYAKKAAADAKPKAEETLERIERGQSTNKSLNDAGGGTGGDDMTAERLLAMPLHEFEAYSAKNPRKVQALMGG